MRNVIQISISSRELLFSLYRVKESTQQSRYDRLQIFCHIVQQYLICFRRPIRAFVPPVLSHQGVWLQPCLDAQRGYTHFAKCVGPFPDWMWPHLQRNAPLHGDIFQSRNLPAMSHGSVCLNQQRQWVNCGSNKIAKRSLVDRYMIIIEKDFVSEGKLKRTRNFSNKRINCHISLMGSTGKVGALLWCYGMGGVDE